MVAHLYEGFFANTQQVAITAQGVELPELGRVKVESLQNIYYPDGSLKDTEVALSFDQPDGQQVGKDIAYNEPAIFDGGRRQVVMLSGQTTASGVTLTRGTDKREFSLKENEPLALEKGSLVLQGFFESRAGAPYALFLWQPEGEKRQLLVMALHAGAPLAQIEIDGVPYRFDRLEESPLVVAIVKYNPAIPLMLISLLLASIATVLLIRWLSRAR
jgi:hypothetical protein